MGCYLGSREAAQEASVVVLTPSYHLGCQFHLLNASLSQSQKISKCQSSLYSYCCYSNVGHHHLVLIAEVIVQLLSRVRLAVTSMDCSPPYCSVGSPRQQYWSGLPFPSPRDLSNPGMELMSPALAGRFFTTELPGKPQSRRKHTFSLGVR